MLPTCQPIPRVNMEGGINVAPQNLCTAINVPVDWEWTKISYQFTSLKILMQEKKNRIRKKKEVPQQEKQMKQLS
jgi:hypothetical protein